MEQLGLFHAKDGDSSSRKASAWKLFVDGASRGNPGKSGAGVWLTKDAIDVVSKGFFLGKATNNQAEYAALLLGIFFAIKGMQKGDKLVIYSDSQLIVRQLIGRYRVKAPHIIPLYQQAVSWLSDINYSVKHVLRDKNTVADRLANEGIEAKNPLPRGFVLPVSSP